ncbi:MAG: helix-turn-helix domain-containing protein [Methanosarcinaceae archaeon]|nr:helix-turn-helix domain-containing protein [Methanosarcinaceae archaeon]
MASSIPEMLRANIRCDDVAKCILGLKTLDMDSYKALLAHGSMTAEKLGELLNRERSTAYRSLQNLISCGLVYRETRSIDVGGYYYEYVAIDPCEMKKMIKSNIDEWHSKMTVLVENIDEEIMAN